MATKSVTIKETAYEILKSRKNEGESFSDVIERIASRRSLTELLDVLSEEEGESLADEVEKTRKELDEEISERSKEVQGALE